MLCSVFVFFFVLFFCLSGSLASLSSLILLFLDHFHVFPRDLSSFLHTHSHLSTVYILSVSAVGGDSRAKAYRDWVAHEFLPH